MQVQQTGYTNQQLTIRSNIKEDHSAQNLLGIDSVIWYFFSWTHYLCVFYSQPTNFLVIEEESLQVTKKLSPSTNGLKGITQRTNIGQIPACSQEPVEYTDTNIVETSTCLKTTQEEMTNFTVRLLIESDWLMFSSIFFPPLQYPSGMSGVVAKYSPAPYA